MALLDDELDRYRTPRELMAKGASVTELTGEAARNPTGAVRNPNVGPGGSIEARGFQASRAAAANPTAAAAAAPAARGFIARGAAALAPTTPIGMALTAATALPAMAEAGRERGAGRSANDPTAGIVEAGDQRPGQLGAIRTDALQQARGESLRAAYADPSLAGQSVGGFNAGMQQRANEIAVANTPLPPTGAGAGRGFVNRASVQPVSDVIVENGRGTVVPPTGGAGAGRGFVNPSAATAPPAEPQGNGVQTISDYDRQLAAEGAARAAAEPRNAGAGSLSSGYSADLARKNAETTARSMLIDARGEPRGVQRGAVAQAGEVLEGERAQRLANQSTEAAGARAQLADATTRRGQDVEAGFRTAAARNAIDVANIQGKTQRDVAGLNADGRVEAAEARGFRAAAPRFTVVPGGQEVREVNGIPMTVTVPARVLNNQTGQFVDAPQGGAAAAQGGAAVTPKAEYDKLPKGARYVGPDGKTYVKG
jgi:hypothetical protein